jgi:hypothetical protein
LLGTNSSALIFYSDRGNNRNGQESRTNYLRDSKEIEKTNAGADL